MSQLPPDILRKIAVNLEVEDIIALKKINKNANTALKNNDLWTYLFKRDFKLSKRGYDKMDWENIIESYKNSYIFWRKVDNVLAKDKIAKNTEFFNNINKPLIYIGSLILSWIIIKII